MVTVHVNRAKLTARFTVGREAAGYAVSEQILQDCNQYAVPDDGEHTLKDSGRASKYGDGWAVTWSTPYAAFQFYGCWPDGSHRIQRHTQGYTQNPSIMWTEVTRSRYWRDWLKVVKKAHIEGAE